MKRAAATIGGGRHAVAAFDATPAFPCAAAVAGKYFARVSTGQGGANMPSAAAVSIMAAAFVTLLAQAALVFQRYRFDCGVMLGTTLAAVNWYEDAARRNGIAPSRPTLILIATGAAALAFALQQAARVLVVGLPPSITHS